MNNVTAIVTKEQIENAKKVAIDFTRELKGSTQFYVPDTSLNELKMRWPNAHVICKIDIEEIEKATGLVFQHISIITGMNYFVVSFQTKRD